jgi:hypothetical protein
MLTFKALTLKKAFRQSLGGLQGICAWEAPFLLSVKNGVFAVKKP